MKRFLSMTMIYYFLSAFIIFFNIDINKVRVGHLNYLKESAFYPVMYLDRKAGFEERQFRYARKYYQTLVDLIPVYEKTNMVNGPATLSRAYAMIALCDYYLGKPQEAIGLFNKALKIEPRYFWFNYNLGVIYFQLGDYQTALTYLKDFFSLDEGKLNASMGLDYYEFWEPTLAEKYKKVSLAKFYEVSINSYKLAILAYERMKNPLEMKNLSLVAIQSGLANKDHFFYYYAGLTSQRPEVGQELFDLVFNPSIYFVSIGQEKYLARRR